MKSLVQAITFMSFYNEIFRKGIKFKMKEIELHYIEKVLEEISKFDKCQLNGIYYLRQLAENFHFP